MGCDNIQIQEVCIGSCWGRPALTLGTWGFGSLDNVA